MKNKKLELQWPNKEKALYYDVESGSYEWVDKKDPRVTEPRILVEKNAYGDSETENILIKGDNLLALKALQQDFQRQIKLIFIDPPYNTGNAFPQYDDGMEHSLWMGLMQSRLEALYKLLSPDGSIWITIDDDESHYLKVMCDEVFGRNNFVASVVWQKIHSTKNDAKYLSVNHDYILVYAKDINKISIPLLQRTEKMNARYKNPDNDPRGPWQSGDLVANEERTNGRFEILGPTGKSFNVPAGKHWVYTKAGLEEMIKDNRIWFGKNGDSFPRKKRFLSEVQQGRKADTWWTSDEVGHNQEGKREVLKFNAEDVFATPKPERLLNRIIDLGSSEGDWVLDSFAGSGTTGAVAHKKGRKWIMVELGNHAETHIIPRLRAVVSGKDNGGVTKLVDWKGGSGFKYFELGDSLFVRDSDLRLTVINPKMYNGALIRAVLKIEGFKLVNPDNGLHGKSGTTAAHVTEQYLSQDYVDAVVNEINDQAKFIVIYAKTISSKLKLPENVEVKRMPEVLLKKFTV
jgi:adenine-specific DNA-methyltransferase